MEVYDRILSTTLSSHPLTHYRLKMISTRAQCTEDHISRIGLGLSIRKGSVEADWVPSQLESEEGKYVGMNDKVLKGTTLFKDELPLWIALILRNNQPANYREWRKVIISHWERGVEELALIDSASDDWVRSLKSCLPN